MNHKEAMFLLITIWLLCHPISITKVDGKSSNSQKNFWEKFEEGKYQKQLLFWDSNFRKMPTSKSVQGWLAK